MDLTLNYNNNVINSVSTGPLLIVPTISSETITIPTSVGNNTSNQDSLTTIIALHYGISSNFEIYGSASTRNSYVRNSSENGFTNQSSRGFGSSSLGGSYRIKSDSTTPSLSV